MLEAVYWIAGSWRETKEETISKCFKKCGFGVEKDGPESSGTSNERIVTLTMKFHCVKNGSGSVWL